MPNANDKRATKVCLVSPKAYPLFVPSLEQLFGGAELDLYVLACELAKDKRYDVSFVVADYGQPDREVIRGVTVHKGVDFKRNALTGARQLWQAMKRADADVYLQETTSMGTFLVACFCKRFRRRFIYRTAHRNDCDGTYIRKHPFAGRAYRWALRQAAQVIVQNDQDRELIRATIGVDSVVIRNAHELPLLGKTERDNILWVGRSAAFKRPRLFLDMAKRTPGEEFVMICQCATEDNNYRRLQQEASAIPNLQFIPHVPFHEVGAYFQRAKMVINTSDSEGFANTFVDACKAGTPILSLDVNPDDFLDEHGCGICADGDWDRFLEAFDRLRGDPQKRLELGANGRRYVEENHNIVDIVEDYKAVFSQ